MNGYTYIKEKTLDKLCMGVEEYLKSGWIPHGDLFKIQGTEGARVPGGRVIINYYVQILVHPKEPNHDR